MQCCVTKASEWKYEEIVEINTLEELIEFGRKNGSFIFYADNKREGCDHSILIYDDYIE